MSETLIKVDKVAKKFCRNLKRSLWYGMKDVGSELLGRSQGTDGELRRDEFWALRDISFEVKRGECLGLLGRNGAGKSTLLKMLNGLLKPDAGRIEMHGRVAALIELGAGFNPILTGRENIYVNGAVLGFTKQEIDRKFDAIVDFSELEEFIDSPVKNYSSGMKVRLGFAVAAQLEPDVLLIDEVLSVGDVGFKIKCYNEIYRIVKDAAVIFVSHSMPQVGKICSGGAVMQNGVVKTLTNNVAEAIAAYNDLFSFGSMTSYGTGRARIEQMAIGSTHELNPQAIDTLAPSRPVVLEFGQALHIELVVLIDPAVENFLVHFNFIDIDQRAVAQCRCPDPIRNIDQPVRLHVALTSFSLNTGVYAVDVVVQEASDNRAAEEFLHGCRSAACIQVVSEKYKGAASVQFEASWTVTPQPLFLSR